MTTFLEVLVVGLCAAYWVYGRNQWSWQVQLLAMIVILALAIARLSLPT
jgi:hypothetical protein